MNRQGPEYIHTAHDTLLSMLAILYNCNWTIILWDYHLDYGYVLQGVPLIAQRPVVLAAYSIIQCIKP